MPTITELKTAIVARASELNSKGYLSLRKFNAITSFNSNWKKVNYVSCLEYLSNSKYDALLASHVEPVELAPIPEKKEHLYTQPSTIDTINYLVSNGCKINLVTTDTVDYVYDGIPYTLAIQSDCLTVNTNKPIEHYTKYHKLSEIFNKATEVYTAPTNVNYLDEIAKHNEKIANRYVPSGQLADSNTRNVETSTFIAGNKYRQSKIGAYDALKGNTDLGLKQDISYWLQRIYIEWYSADQVTAIATYLNHVRDEIKPDFQEYCNQHGHTIVETTNTYGLPEYIVNYAFPKDAMGNYLRCKITFNDFLYFAKRDLCLDPFLGAVSVQRCPKMVALMEITKDYNIVSITPNISLLTGMIELDMRNTIPVINISGNEYRISEQYFIANEHSDKYSINKTVNTRIVGNPIINNDELSPKEKERVSKCRKSSLARNRPYEGSGKDKAPKLFKLSKHELLDTGNMYNGAYLVYEPIEHSYIEKRVNQKTVKVLPDSIKKFCADNGVSSQSKILGKIICQNETSQITLGIVVIKHSKLWFYLLPQKYTYQHYHTVGRVKKQVETFEINYKPTTQDRRRSIDQVVTKTVKEIEVSEVKYSSTPTLETHFQHVDPEVLNFSSMHGLRDNRPICPSKITVNWSVLLNLKLYSDSHLTGKECPYRVIN